MDSNQLKLLIPVAVCHALGHVTSNVSFAAVAVSFTHTVKGDLQTFWVLNLWRDLPLKEKRPNTRTHTKTEITFAIHSTNPRSTQLYAIV